MSEPVKYTPEEIESIRDILAGPLAFMFLDDGQQHVAHARWIATVDALTRDLASARTALAEARERIVEALYDAYEIEQAQAYKDTLARIDALVGPAP